MSQAPLATIQRSAISGFLLVAVLIAGASGATASDGCPNSTSEISTDRPDVTNSSRVAPYGSLQAENGVTVRQGSDVLSGSETRLRLGVAQCTEVLADLPTYFYSLNGRAVSGFSYSLCPSSGNYRSHLASIYLQPAVWDFPPALARFRVTDTIPTFSSRGRNDSLTTGLSTVCSPSHGSRASTQSIRPWNRRSRLSGT